MHSKQGVNMTINKRASWILSAFLMLALGVAACGGTPSHHPNSPHVRKQANNVTSDMASNTVEPDITEDEIELNVGDSVTVTTFGQEDLSGEFKVQNNGHINMPLIGHIRAAGRTKNELENAIRATLASGYLVDPKVSVQIASFRQFYIVGEVDTPGAYDYVPSLNVLKAVAIAGGFTRRAEKEEFIILRRVGGKERRLEATETSEVLPGDTIRIDERFF